MGINWSQGLFYGWVGSHYHWSLAKVSQLKTDKKNYSSGTSKTKWLSMRWECCNWWSKVYGLPGLRFMTSEATCAVCCALMSSMWHAESINAAMWSVWCCLLDLKWLCQCMWLNNVKRQFKIDLFIYEYCSCCFNQMINPHT